MEISSSSASSVAQNAQRQTNATQQTQQQVVQDSASVQESPAITDPNQRVGSIIDVKV